jgi:deoxyribodipyrimidine photolyase-related protein
MTTLYWHFLATHEEALSRNPRAALMMKNFQRLSAEEKTDITHQAALTLANLEQL